MKNLHKIGFDKYAVTRDGRVYSLRSGRFLSTNKMAGNYRAVTLSQDGTRQEFTIHRLVALAYLTDDCNFNTYNNVSVEYLVVNHLDANTLNNNVSNLEWTTQKKNVQHSVNLGNYKTINEYRALNDEIIHYVCSLLEKGSRNKDIQELTGLSQNTISGIKSGKHYGDITEEYDFRKVPSSNRISEDKVLKICKMLEDGYSVNKVRLQTNVAHHTVKSIKNRKTYTYLSENFDW